MLTEGLVLYSPYNSSKHFYIYAEINPKCWALLAILRMVLDRSHHVPDTHLFISEKRLDLKDKNEQLMDKNYKTPDKTPKLRPLL